MTFFKNSTELIDSGRFNTMMTEFLKVLEKESFTLEEWKTTCFAVDQEQELGAVVSILNFKHSMDLNPGSTLIQVSITEVVRRYGH